MKLHPRVTKAAVELVKRFEGLRRRAARLPDGGWTLGYGHTMSAREGAMVTPEEAELLLYYDLSEVATKVEAWTFTPLNQNQFEALTAFAFNIGLDNFRRSTVLKRVNEGQHLQAAAAMELWRKSDVDGEGIVVDALVRRRAAEKAHYLTPPEGFRPSPSQVLRPAFDFSVIEAAAQSQVAQRAAVVDAPLEGDHAVASVEVAPEPTSEFEPTPSVIPAVTEETTQHLQTVLPDAEAPGAPTAAEEGSPNAVAELSAAPVLYAPEARKADETERSAHGFAEATAVAVGAAAVASPFVFRGFEPPPSRFAPSTEAPPTPANQHEAERAYAEPLTEAPFALTAADPVESSTAAFETAGEAEPEPAATAATEFNLFDRPLAPPAPADATLVPVRSARLRDDEDGFDAATLHVHPAEAPEAPAPTSIGGLLQNRTVLFASIGILGVVLFFSAITTTLVGRATWAHLLIGFLGVLFITPAGVYFLLRRMHKTPDLEDIANN